MSTTAFVGMSHLGINYAAAWSSFGQQTIGFDLDSDLVARLDSRDLPLHEPGLPELLERSGTNLSFSADFSRLRECSLVVVARDVPTDDSNTSNLDAVRDLIDAARDHLAADTTLVVMSQVPPGFTRGVADRLRHDRVQVYYWVETLVFGDAVRRATRPERIIVGCSDPHVLLPSALADGLAVFDCPVLPMVYESAELTKTAINLYLAGSVTYANTLSDLCESLGARWDEMVPALRLDARIGPAAYLRPGLGIAGGNLERDLVTLSGLCSAGGVDATYIDALIAYNDRRLEWVHRQLRARVLGAGTAPNLAVWGLTYKKNTRSTKNSPSLRVIEALASRAHIRAWDPAIAPGELQIAAEVVSDAYAATQDADCLLIMADWDQFAQADVARLRASMRRPLIVDCAGVLEQRRSELAGIEYVGMGR
jgi:UDPglucose 6-dehydrogenase